MSLFGLGGSKKICYVCGEKLKVGEFDCHRFEGEIYLCSKDYPSWGFDYSVERLKGMQFNSEVQVSLRSKFKETERYGDLIIDRKNELYSNAYQIGPANPILPISSIVNMEIKDGTKETYYVFHTAYEEWPVTFSSLFSKDYHKDLASWEIRNERSMKGVKAFYEFSQKVRKETIDSGRDPIPDVFKGSFAKP